MRLPTILFLAIGASAFLQNVQADDAVYLLAIKPVLKERCYSCHGSLKQESDLRLDTAEQIVDSGIVDSGELLRRIKSHDIDERMPPEGEPLTPKQIAAIDRWIQSGSKLPTNEVAESDPRSHWSFQQFKKAKLPKSKFTNPIDILLNQARDELAAAQQVEKKLLANATAEPIVLLRRLYLDLTGIPPTLEQIKAFLNAPTDKAYQAVVEDLLGSPQHGERWARHWMDVWRYSDWWGLGDQHRNSQKHIWHWRDWIVESLNDDLGYDEMVRQMLAADELYPNDLNKLRATGYLGRNWFIFNRHQWLDEAVEHVGKGFLGLTMNCAKCHDHKYDPISQKDYYRMRGFFEPYHLRLDMVAGQTDLKQNGIPRVFDAYPETPTYLFVRGDEKNPDKSTAITPGVPSIFEFDPNSITAVNLPIHSWNPGHRFDVAENYRIAAKNELAAANKKLKTAKSKMLLAEKLVAKFAADATKEKLAADANSQLPVQHLVQDSFLQLDPKLWKPSGGDWKFIDGKLHQTKDGANNSVLQLLKTMPRDFDATFKFSILGGSKWRSVGITFDATQKDFTKPPTNSDTRNQVYISAVAGGSKIQGAVQIGNAWQYPANAQSPQNIQLNKTYALKVQVRDRLLNASINGTHSLSWKLPHERKNGSLLLTTFDAIVQLDEFQLQKLNESVVLRNATGSSEAVPRTLAAAKELAEQRQRELRLAQSAIGLAKSKLDWTIARGKAIQALKQKSEYAKSKSIAIKSERKHKVAEAQHNQLTIEIRLASANGKDEQNKQLKSELAAAKVAVEAATKLTTATINPDDNFTSFVGSKWTATRFANSAADDPTPTYPKQSTGRRSALARWIASPTNPLTARVAVNQIWMRHMGSPLVDSVFDFGRRSSQPIQHRLLDWLASDFVQHNWNMKRLHRLIVTSDAYQMSSSVQAAAQKSDRDNRLLTHRVPIRLESQVIRDSILFHAGSLDLTMGGPPVPVNKQEQSQRRSLYFFHSNNSRNQFLNIFDEALVTDCYRREQSIVPQQSLALTNSKLTNQAVKQIAEKFTQGAADDRKFVSDCFMAMLGIVPNINEINASLHAIDEWTDVAGGTQKAARQQFFKTLINHSDFVTIR